MSDIQKTAITRQQPEYAIADFKSFGWGQIADPSSVPALLATGKIVLSVNSFENNDFRFPVFLFSERETDIHNINTVNGAAKSFGDLNGDDRNNVSGAKAALGSTAKVFCAKMETKKAFLIVAPEGVRRKLGLIRVMSVDTVQHLISKELLPPLPQLLKEALEGKPQPISYTIRLKRRFNICQNEDRTDAQILKGSPRLYFLANPKSVDLVTDILGLRDYFHLKAADVDSLTNDEASELVSHASMSPWNALRLSSKDPEKRDVVVTTSPTLVDLIESIPD